VAGKPGEAVRLDGAARKQKANRATGLGGTACRLRSRGQPPGAWIKMIAQRGAAGVEVLASATDGLNRSEKEKWCKVQRQIECKGCGNRLRLVSLLLG